MKIKSEKDFWAGLMFMATGLGFAGGATNYSFGSSARPGPGYFPFGLGILLAILGAFIVFESLTVSTRDGEKIGAIPFKPMFLIILAVVLFGVTLPLLGMFIALPLLILISSLAGDEFKLIEVILVAVVLTVGSWLVFIKGLNLVIPLWPSFLGA